MRTPPLSRVLCRVLVVPAVLFAAPLLAPVPAAQAESCGSYAPGGHPLARRAVTHACRQLGIRYAWGGGHGSRPGPTRGQCDAAAGAPEDCHHTGLDCSGLVRYGYHLATGRDPLGAGSSRDQWRTARVVDRFSAFEGTDPLLPGDLVYYGASPERIRHVALYLGNGYVVEAPFPGGRVRVAEISYREGYFGALRLYRAA